MTAHGIALRHATAAALLQATKAAASNTRAQSAYQALQHALDKTRVSIACSGAFMWGHPALVYKKSDGTDWKELRLWIASAADFEDLCSACAPASFGKGTELVLDPAFRSALALRPDHFACPRWELDSSAEAPTGVLRSVHRMLGPEFATIRAQLHKLNVYREGDFFKAHKDTLIPSPDPREAMFGSLVVTLPVAHTGGALVVEHDGKATTFDMSFGGELAAASEGGAAGSSSSSVTPAFAPESSAPHPLPVRWAAFYSDCLHEVQPVTSGYRVTLTYNLYGTAAIVTPSKTSSQIWRRSLTKRRHWQRRRRLQGAPALQTTVVWMLARTTATTTAVLTARGTAMVTAATMTRTTFSRRSGSVISSPFSRPLQW